MKAWEIVGYVYEAALHCPDCAEKRFGDKLKDEKNPPEDSEGSPVSPVFACDEPGDGGDFCDDCFEPLDNTTKETVLDYFLRENRADMLADLTEIVKTAKEYIAANPEELTEPSCDEPTIDVRLCIDAIMEKGKRPTWLFRTGDASYDQYHSQFCAASCIGDDTDPTDLLDELVNDLYRG